MATQPTVVTVRQFTAGFAEFRNSDQGLITRCLLEAESLVDAKVWGSRHVDGVKYCAAMLMAQSPTGEASRLVKKETVSVYESHYKRMQRMVATGYRNT